MTNEEIVLKVQQGDNVSDNMALLYQNNIVLIRKFCKPYKSYCEFDDLMQEAYLALHRAAECYEMNRGVLFMSFAQYYIKKYCQRYIDINKTQIRIPVYMRGLVRKYEKLNADFQKFYGRKPSDSQIAYFLDIDDKTLDDIRKALKTANTESMEKPVVNGEGISIADTVIDPNNLVENFIESFTAESNQTELWGVVDSLEEVQATVIKARYKSDLTFKEIGERMGLSGQRARTIESKALRELRHKEEVRRIARDADIYSDALIGGGVGVFNITWTSSTEKTALRFYEND